MQRLFRKPPQKNSFLRKRLLAYNCTLGFDECELKNMESDSVTKSVKLHSNARYPCVETLFLLCGNDVPTLR